METWLAISLGLIAGKFCVIVVLAIHEAYRPSVANRVVLLVIGLLMFCLSALTLTKVFMDDYKDNKTENTCIREKVKLGIERKNILRNNGSCAVIKPSS